MSPRKNDGRNEPPVLDAERELRLAQRAGFPVIFAGPDDASPMTALVTTDGPPMARRGGHGLARYEVRARGGDFPHYIGQRRGGSARVIRVGGDGQRTELEPRHHLRNHSPDGFEWGYLGSGPAQLALAICADVFEDERKAVELYQIFKERVVARLRHNRWRLTALEVRAALDAIETERADV